MGELHQWPPRTGAAVEIKFPFTHAPDYRQVPSAPSERRSPRSLNPSLSSSLPRPSIPGCFSSLKPPRLGARGHTDAPFGSPASLLHAQPPLSRLPVAHPSHRPQPHPDPKPTPPPPPALPPAGPSAHRSAAAPPPRSGTNSDWARGRLEASPEARSRTRSRPERRRAAAAAAGGAAAGGGGDGGAGPAGTAPQPPPPEPRGAGLPSAAAPRRAPGPGAPAPSPRGGRRPRRPLLTRRGRHPPPRRSWLRLPPRARAPRPPAAVGSPAAASGPPRSRPSALSRRRRRDER